MKRFLAVTIHKRAKYGSNVVQKIYRIKNNKLILLGEHTFNTGSMKGYNHEVAGWLADNKYIPKTWVTKGTTYINYDVYDTYNEGKGKYHIHEIQD